MKTIRQSVTFKASPREIYEALMDSKKHSEFTGSEVRTSRNVGSEFSVYGEEVPLGQFIKETPGIREVLETI